MKNKKSFVVLSAIFLLFVAFVNAESLPIIGSEEQRDQHGNILNKYLLVAHTENGTLKNSSVQDYMLNLSGITLADFSNDRLDLWSLLNFTNAFTSRLSELWNLANFTSAYNARTDRYSNSNFTAQYDGIGDRYSSSNYSSEYSSTGYKKANVTSDYPNLDLNLGDDFSSGNFTGLINNYIPSFFNIANFTANYDARTDRYGNANFTSQYDARTDRFGISNYTALESSAFNKANYTALEDSAFRNGNFSTQLSTSIITLGQVNGRDFVDGLKIGSGANITKHLSATTNLDFNDTTANCESLTMEVIGASDGDVVALGVPNALASITNTTFNGFVSGADTVTVRRCNIGVTSNPAGASVRVDVWKH